LSVLLLHGLLCAVEEAEFIVDGMEELLVCELFRRIVDSRVAGRWPVGAAGAAGLPARPELPARTER
jgi:hypothetical protein